MEEIEGLFVVVTYYFDEDSFCSGPYSYEQAIDVKHYVDTNLQTNELAKCCKIAKLSFLD